MPATSITCNCGATATHAYGRLRVCGNCYRAAAAIDDSPRRIPKNYDWTAEMNGRRLKPNTT